MVKSFDRKYIKLPQYVTMNEADLDNAIAQAEQFLVFARELKTGFEKQKAEMLKAEASAITQKLSEKEVKDEVFEAKWRNSPNGTRIVGAVKHACVTLSFTLSKLRK